MRKILVIALREYKAAVKSKAFLIGLLIMPVLMVGSGVLNYVVKRQSDIGEKRFAVVDRTPGGKIFPLLHKAAERHNTKEIYDKETHKQVEAVFDLVKIDPPADDPQAVADLRYELSERVLRGEFFGFVEIGPDATKPPNLTDANAADRPDPLAYLRYQTNHPTYPAFQRWAQQQLTTAIVREQIPPFARTKQVDEMLASGKLPQPPTLRVLGLSKRDPATGQVSDPRAEQVVARFLVPFGLVMLMFMVVMMGSTPAMQGVVEEKSLRIAEVLLGSVPPFQLMMGKLLGLMGTSLTVAAVYLVGIYWMAHKYEVTEFLQPDILAWFLLFQVLSLLMYGSLFLAVGAAASDVKETQTLIMPIVLLAVLPLMVMQVLIENPNNALAVGLSFFPFVTPMLMTARLAVPPGIPWWQPLVGIALVLLTTTLCVYAAGRIFRVGILMQGKGTKFSDLLKWAVRG